MKWQMIKTILWSAIGGALVWWIVLSAGFGWTSASSADQQAVERAETAVLDVLTPICVAGFKRDADHDAKLATLKAKSNWTRDDYVMEQGWATMPGSTEPEQRIAQQCANRILTPAS